jgi:hypothetical protein
MINGPLILANTFSTVGLWNCFHFKFYPFLSVTSISHIATQWGALMESEECFFVAKRNLFETSKDRIKILFMPKIKNKCELILRNK